MIDLSSFEIWLVPGSQLLYGEEVLHQVAAHAQEMAASLAASPAMPFKVVCQPVTTTADSITQLCRQANQTDACIGVVAWMHTFSPAQMWIPGLRALRKPLAHLHTQFNHDLPWSTLDMDFMNLNQSAHGDREFGHLTSRLRLHPKLIVGFWRDEQVQNELATWARAACAWHDAQGLKVARFGDNMRRVAVTEGDKVEARIQLGYAVEGHGVGELAARVEQTPAAEVEDLISAYEAAYTVAPALRPGGAQRPALYEAARLELGLRHFLEDGGYGAFTDTFEDLNGLGQLPGVGVQRLMADGYGFGAEGDWKTAALLRAMKVMSTGLPGGTSFMEDYTYHFAQGGQVLGAHMLEVCPSIAAARPTLEIHPLAIGGKSDPVRLVFDARTGPAVVASLIDRGDRFCLIVNQINSIPIPEPLPRLPVARALWIPEPNLKIAASCWILAGGAHHTGFSLALTTQHLEDFAEMAHMEFLLIDAGTTAHAFKNELRWNDASYRLAPRG